MSDRPMAQRHEWVARHGDQAVERAGETARVFWRGSVVHGWSWWSWDEQVGLELLRLVAERDEAREALQEMEDAHSEETGARCRAEDERDALGKALLIAYEWAAGYPLGGAMDQTAATTVYAAAESALRDAGLLLEGK